MFLVCILTDADVAGGAEARADLRQHPFERARADDGAEEIDHREVSIADAVQQDDVSHKVGVGLLPEGFLALAPYRRDDGGDVERLRVGIERVVQRVVANVAVERDLDIILFPPAPLEDALKLAAEIAFDLKDDAGELPFGIVGLDTRTTGASPAGSAHRFCLSQ